MLSRVETGRCVDFQVVRRGDFGLGGSRVDHRKAVIRAQKREDEPHALDSVHEAQHPKSAVRAFRPNPLHLAGVTVFRPFFLSV